MQADPALELWVRVAAADSTLVGIQRPGDPADLLQNLTVVPGVEYYITVYAAYGTTGDYSVTADFYPDEPGFDAGLSPSSGRRMVDPQCMTAPCWCLTSLSPPLRTGLLPRTPRSN